MAPQQLQLEYDDELELIREILMSDEDYVSIPEPPRIPTAGWVATDDNTPQHAMVQPWPPVELSAIPFAHSVDPRFVYPWGVVPSTRGYVVTRITLNQ